jgi:hypothetical protein
MADKELLLCCYVLLGFLSLSRPASTPASMEGYRISLYMFTPRVCDDIIHDTSSKILSRQCVVQSRILRDSLRPGYWTLTDQSLHMGRAIRPLYTHTYSAKIRNNSAELHACIVPSGCSAALLCSQHDHQCSVTYRKVTFQRLPSSLATMRAA